MGESTENGVLLKVVIYLQRLDRVDIVLFLGECKSRDISTVGKGF